MKYANLHSEYASNLAMIKALKWHMDACDIISDPRNNKGFVIPDLVCPILAYLVEDCWCKR
jgi:2-keto-4-pentenoate hydratase